MSYLEQLKPNYFHTKNGLRLFYQTNYNQNFEKPLLVFNYGLVCNHRHWQEQLPFFIQNEYPVLIHDYRFHFNSSETKEGALEDCRFSEIASDLNQLLAHIGCGKHFHIGHSMGVNICLEYCRRYPENILGNVLISGTVLPPQGVMFNSSLTDVVLPYIEWFRKEFPDSFGKLWSTSYMNPIAKYLVYTGGFNTKKVSPEFVEIYLKKISELPQGLLFHLLEEMRNHDILSHLNSIQIPSLVMGGDQDKVIPFYLQRLLDDLLPNTELYLIKDGSHVPQVDFPESVNERIQIFIEQQSHDA